MFKPIKTPETQGGFFGSIARNLTFEDDSDKNAKNGSDSSQQNDKDSEDSGDSKLNDSLSDLKNQKEEQDDSNKSNSSDGDNSDPSDQKGPSEVSGEDLPNEDSSGSDETSPVQQNDSAPSTDVPSSEHANRKLKLYEEYNRIYQALKESVELLSDTQASGDEIKSCVAQLQDVVTDMRAIIADFVSYTESDLMIHLQMFKERSSLTLEQITRIKKSKGDN